MIRQTTSKKKASDIGNKPVGHNQKKKKALAM